MADILYVYKTSIYANLTNKCPCRCTFCIRNNTDSVGSADTLWHKHDPSMEDIKKAVDDFDFTWIDDGILFSCRVTNTIGEAMTIWRKVVR